MKTTTRIAMLVSAVAILACTPAYASMTGADITMSVRLDINLSSIEELADSIDKIAELDKAPLLDDIGAELESQTRDRLANEKSSPDGEQWPAWSTSYAETRHSGHSLLESSGFLIDSIQSEASTEMVSTGSNLPYAAIHNFGGEIKRKSGAVIDMPQREYLGLNGENEEDIYAVVIDFYQAELSALA